VRVTVPLPTCVVAAAGEADADFAFGAWRADVHGLRGVDRGAVVAHGNTFCAGACVCLCVLVVVILLRAGDVNCARGLALSHPLARHCQCFRAGGIADAAGTRVVLLMLLDLWWWWWWWYCCS
jgi:hypothetical protein